MSSPLTCYCSICRSEMLFENRYGRDACCCGKDCWQEFDWRLTLSILGKPYRPDPKRLAEAGNPRGDVTCGVRPTLPDEVPDSIRVTPREQHDWCANPNCRICTSREKAERETTP